MDFDLDHDSEGLTRSISRRPLTDQEKEWVNAILQTNQSWADVSLGEIFADGECTCGCRTVHLSRPLQPQNARTAHLLHETVGVMWIFTELGKTIGVILHAKYGSLGELEVLYQESAEPWPSNWREVRRKFL